MPLVNASTKKNFAHIAGALEAIADSSPLLLPILSPKPTREPDSAAKPNPVLAQAQSDIDAAHVDSNMRATPRRPKSDICWVSAIMWV